MRIMERCLYCYQPLEQGQVDFHPQCSKKIFGAASLYSVGFNQLFRSIVILLPDWKCRHAPEELFSLQKGR